MYNGCMVNLFMTRVQKTETCWLWTKTLTEHGYGRYSGTVAHKKLWEHLNGPTPTGFELDHLCRVRHCVNPDHLELVTHAENVRRGNGGRKPAIKCPAGHEYVGTNIYVRPDGRGRGCRTCIKARNRASRKGSRT